VPVSGCPGCTFKQKVAERLNPKLCHEKYRSLAGAIAPFRYTLHPITQALAVPTSDASVDPLISLIGSGWFLILCISSRAP